MEEQVVSEVTDTGPVHTFPLECLPPRPSMNLPVAITSLPVEDGLPKGDRHRAKAALMFGIKEHSRALLPPIKQYVQEQIAKDRQSKWAANLHFGGGRRHQVHQRNWHCLRLAEQADLAEAANGTWHLDELEEDKQQTAAAAPAATTTAVPAPAATAAATTAPTAAAPAATAVAAAAPAAAAARPSPASSSWQPALPEQAARPSWSRQGASWSTSTSGRWHKGPIGLPSPPSSASGWWWSGE